MKLYEIDEAIMNLFDPDTGECVDYDALESLQMERDRKIEGIALWIKDLEADAVKIRNEEKALAERRRSMESKADNLTKFLAGVVGEGNRFSTSKCAISWRKSESVRIIFAIRQMAALAITHPKSYDILFHLRALVDDLMGVKS